MALTPRLVSGLSAKRPEPSGINAMLRVQQNSTGQPWVRPAKSMLTEDKPNPLHNCGAPSSPQGRVPRDCLGSEREQLLLDVVMFPQTDEISTIISDTVKVVF